MAATKETRSKRVEEARARWIEMSPSALKEELQELRVKSEHLYEEVSVIRALIKALETYLEEEGIEEDEESIYRSDAYASEEDFY